MGLFDFFKKEEKVEDLTLFNLQIGSILEYDLSTWVIKDKTDYDWGNNQFTFEYSVENGTDSAYIHIHDSTPSKIDVSAGIKMFELGPEVKQTIVESDNPPKKITFKEIDYFLSDEFMGHCKSVNEDDDDWSKFVNWVFNNKDESEFVSISRWGETEMDAVHGKYSKEFEFSNFLSSPKK
jgi:hypothetical protein